MGFRASPCESRHDSLFEAVAKETCPPARSGRAKWLDGLWVLGLSVVERLSDCRAQGIGVFGMRLRV